jgi:hypothetical protein
VESDTSSNELLTKEESAVLDALATAYNRFVSLETLHGWHQEEFMHAIHRAQHLVLARPAIKKQLSIDFGDRPNAPRS